MTAWKIELPGVATFRTDDLTLDEAIAYEEATGFNGLVLNPFSSAKSLRALVKLWLLRSKTEEEAAAIVGGLSAIKAYDATNEAKDDLPDSYGDGGIPKAEGAASMTTSSPASSDSDGPPT